MINIIDSEDLTILPLAIAPMIDWTNTYFRILMRILAPKALLYTEMQTTGAVLNNPYRALQHSAFEYPLALQLGGSNSQDLAECAEIAEQRGFCEVNLNLGCPSPRVQAGSFGACLMSEPKLVAECIAAMKQRVSIPVSAKVRIGIDHQDNYEFFSDFVRQLIDAGCDKIIVHARKAWLNGLSPKQNRTIPSLHYDYVYRIKQEFKAIPIVINGNVVTVDAILSHLQEVDGVMIGRLVCQNPYVITLIHKVLYPEIPVVSRSRALEMYLAQLTEPKSMGSGLIDLLNQSSLTPLIIKPILNLAHALNGVRIWKETLTAIQRDQKWERLFEIISLMESIETRNFNSISV